MALEFVVEDGLLVVRLAARALDAALAGPLRDGVTARIEAGTERVVINLSGVELLDSTGLGALVSCRKKLGAQGNVCLCHVDPRVVNVLRLTRMDRVFRVVATEDDAVAALAATR